MPTLPYLNHAPVLGVDCLVAPGSWVVGDVRMGTGCTVLFGATVRGDTGDVIIGDDVNVQEGAVVHTETGMTTRIGDRVSIGHQAVVHGAHVGPDCLIGMGAIVLSGSVVGEGSSSLHACSYRRVRTSPPARSSSVYQGRSCGK